ncbi:isochorismatase family cysteine hydrolase [Fictibacillus iocasae]|uniref:Isochorismatase family cysteine hydrolase n=1 Tax=Fictibacillus iocasae TaxID=2715437 RepID=A0ABW2NKA3_9BACL
MEMTVRDGVPVALLIIDMINDYDFEESDLLLAHMEAVAGSIARLKEQAKAVDMPVIYVNDNFGRWQSDRQKLVDYCCGGKGKDVVGPIVPETDDYFIIKPKHSGFFSTPLSSLLNDLNVHTLILTGVAGNICVLFTANDAYMRGFTLHVPSDCLASNIKEDNERALLLMANTLKADTSASGDMDLLHIIEETKNRKKSTIF